MILPNNEADEYAAWFRCLADPTRLQILNLLATENRPMTVGDIVKRAAVGQSTVSAHLRRLAETRFVLVDHHGTCSYFEINRRCVECLPSAAQVIMGVVPAGAGLPPPAPGVTSRRRASRDADRASGIADS